MQAMYKIAVKGIVQGVGFRPYIYRKAKQYKLVGSVRNTGGGVEIIINDQEFMKKLIKADDLPPLANISEFSIEKIDERENKTAYPDFSIIKSKKKHKKENNNKKCCKKTQHQESSEETILPADIYLCKDCHEELKDPKNRRHNYYFITCTNCGPRFSIIKDYPYDRKKTTMNEFSMCPECRKEYTDPNNRRYHAETIACKRCGPKLELFDLQGQNLKKNISGKDDADTIKKAAEIIKSGEIISIKGVGGFHLASKIESVKKIREFLNRPDKPFALMAKNIEMAQKIARVSRTEKELLENPTRPIVVLEKKNPNSLKNVSELSSIGFILPYTALHHLLFKHINEPIVLTSFNTPGEPIIIDENQKKTRYVLLHERKIENRCDDSVVRLIDESSKKIAYLRRSRGFTPLPIKTNISCQDTLALGAELNNVIAIGKGKNIFLSQYIGETSKLKTFEFMKETAEKMIKLTGAKPKLIACDLHPDYNSTQLAKSLAEKYSKDNKKANTKKYRTKLIQIQHHHAHIASVAAEHNLKDYVGIAMDGLGYGEEGNLLGGEIFAVKNRIEFERIGHLEEQYQIGGDSSAIYPKKMLLGILVKFMNEKELAKMKLFNEKETRLYLNQLKEKFNITTTTSTGRTLDAAAALLGICEERTYDGRPAMLLESLAGDAAPYNLKPVFERKNNMIILMTTPLFYFLLKNLKKDKRRLAATAQAYLSKGLFMIAKEFSKKDDLPIAFSGGVAYNRMISRSMLKNGVLMNKEVPCGDGGIAFGQAYLANLMEALEQNTKK